MTSFPEQQPAQPTGPDSTHKCVQREAIREIRVDVRETRDDVKDLLRLNGGNRLIERIVMLAVGAVIAAAVTNSLRAPSPITEASAATPPSVTVILPPTPTTTCTLPSQARRVP